MAESIMSKLMDWLEDAFLDPDKKAAVEADPEGELAKAGIEASPEQIQEVVALAGDSAPAGLVDFAHKVARGHGGGYAPRKVVEKHVHEGDTVYNSYDNSVTNITDQSVNQSFGDGPVYLDQDFNQSNTTNQATGPGSVAGVSGGSQVNTGAGAAQVGGSNFGQVNTGADAILASGGSNVAEGGNVVDDSWLEGSAVGTGNQVAGDDLVVGDGNVVADGSDLTGVVIGDGNKVTAVGEAENVNFGSGDITDVEASSGGFAVVGDVNAPVVNVSGDITASDGSGASVFGDASGYQDNSVHNTDSFNTTDSFNSDDDTSTYTDNSYTDDSTTVNTDVDIDADLI
jgi:hypothetical protein